MKGENKNMRNSVTTSPVSTEQINSPYCLPAAKLGSNKPFHGEPQMTAQAQIRARAGARARSPGREAAALPWGSLAEPFPASSVRARAGEWFICTMEYYSAIKKDELESVLVRWMNPEPIIQSDVSQKEKNKYSKLKHIYEI